MKFNFFNKVSWVVFLVITCSNCVFGQNPTPFFSCPEILEESEKINSLKKLNNNEQAERILELHPVKENEIRYTYIIVAKDTFNIDKMIKYIRLWAEGLNRDNTKIIKKYNLIETAESFTNIGNAKTVCDKISIINATVNYQIGIKNNRIKLDVWTNKYTLHTESRFSSAKARLLSIKENFPINKKGNHKKSLAEAFVHINRTCSNRAQNFLEYLERAQPKSEGSVETDW